MKIWHLTVVILIVAVVLTLFRDPVGRVGVIMFVTGLGEAVFGVTAIMALFQTIGAIGMARGVFEHAEAVAETSLVLVVATAVMSFWLFAGVWLVQATLP